LERPISGHCCERWPSHGELRGLRPKGFVGIASTQSLTSFNDNAYRWRIIPIGIAILGT
jgi:hypothetical protein